MKRLVAVAVILLARVALPAAAPSADPDADKPFLRSWFPGLESGLKDAPPFRDTQLLLQIRTYYRHNEPSPVLNWPLPLL